MVVRSPFLSEKDIEKTYLMRNERIYNVLASLFPNATLEKITEVANVLNSKCLFTGPFTFTEKVIKDKQKFIKSKVVTHAARILKENLIHDKFNTCQNYLNLAIDMRILRKMPTEYVFHSYGFPLSFLLKKIKKPYSKYISWKCYFIDRLLFEDGDFIVKILELLNNKREEINSLSPFEISKLIHDEIFQKLEKEKIKLPFHYRKEIERKIDDYKRSHKDPKKTIRRTELDFTVRREWLKELGIIEVKKNGLELSSIGEKLYKKISELPLNLDFFTEHIFSILAEVFELKEKKNTSIISILEKTFKTILSRNFSIVETLVLIDTAIYLNIPNFIGDRQSIFECLQEGVDKSLTKLVLQNGYMTKNYYVKLR